MTHIYQTSVMEVRNSYYTRYNSKSLKSYQVEIVDFDNETEILHVEAHNEEEASEIAQSQFHGDINYMNIYLM